MIHSSYLWWMAGSALICASVHYFLLKGFQRRALLTVETLLLGAVLGALCGRLGYILLQMEYVRTDGFFSVLLSDDAGTVSYYCAMAGVCLGAFLAAKSTGNGTEKSLNAFAPAGALFASLSRFGEGFLGLQCAGREIEWDLLRFFPVAVKNEWDEWYAAVFMLAGACSLAVFLYSLLRLKEKRALRTVFYLCLPQILCESLRNQSLVLHEFVRVEQLMCMIAMEVILVLYGVWQRRGWKGFWPALAGLGCAGLFVALEFALDKTNIPRVWTYLVMIAGMAVLAVAEHRGFSRLRQRTQS